MYFGSVRFFKHLVLFFICLTFIASTIVIIGLNQKNAALNKELAKYNYDTSTDLSLGLGINIDAYASAAARSIKLPYQQLYPDLYAAPEIEPLKTAATKTIYLTFDDGPSKYTMEILNILDQYNVKATFFVEYAKDENTEKIYKEIVKRGHAIGVHTTSHQYAKIYSSVENYLADFNMVYTQIEEVTGVKTDLFRFPGGSINGYNVRIHEELIAEMLRRGFFYYDWVVSADDTASNATWSSIFKSVVDNSRKYDKPIVLMHDTAKQAHTVEALGDIIVALEKSGYAFDKLDKSVRPYIFAY